MTALIEAADVVIPEVIRPDEVRHEPLEPGISMTRDGNLYTGVLRTFAWNAPDEITLDRALSISGLDPTFWEAEHITEYVWDDGGASLIAFEIRVAEIG